MRKKELRKHADPGLRFSPGHGLLHTEVLNYIIRAAVKNIGGQRVLTVYVYDRQSAAQGNNAPRYTVFQSRQEYITAEHMEGGALRWRSACLYNLLFSGYQRKEYTFYTQKDRDCVTRFCAVKSRLGLEALDKLQSKIMEVRLRERTITRERKILETMEHVPTAPRDLKGWIHREILPAYVFYKYRKGKKRFDGWCTACRHDVQVADARHNAEGRCPRCGRTVIFKPFSRISCLYDRATGQVIQHTGEKELLVRIFKADKHYRSYRDAEAIIWENARFFVRWDDDGEVSIDPYYYSYSGITTRWHRGERPFMNPYARSFEQDTCGNIYLRGLDSVLAGTPWQYSQLQAFYKHDREPMEVLSYLRQYFLHPFIEYFVKLGLHNLAKYAVYGGYGMNMEGKNPREILGVEPEDIPLLQSLDANSRQLRLLHTLRKQGLRPEEPLLRWYGEHEISNMDNLLSPLRYTTSFKLTRYIDGQFERLRSFKTENGRRRYEKLSNVLSEYCDYLRIGKTLGYDLKNTFVLFPSDLRIAHDTAARLDQAKKDAVIEQAISVAYPALEKMYSYSHGGFSIVVPKSAKEIVAEGHALRHCVGSYTTSVAKQKCAILFLRRTDDINAPFVTLRVQDGRLEENRGLCNGEPAPAAKAFLKRWEREVLQPALARGAA